WYPYLWSWGGKEVEADGKTVVLNSRETIESVKFAVGFWKDTCDEGGLAWDDTNNNRAFLSGTISATNNGASIYIEAKKKPETYLTEKGTPMWQDIVHADIPKGASGPYNLPGTFTDMLMGYSKNQKAANPILMPSHDWQAKGRLVGYARPPSRKAAEVVSKYIVVDMYAKAIQGMPAEDAAKWAHGEAAKAYA